MEFKYNKSQVSIEIKTFTDNLFYENIKVGKIRQNTTFRSVVGRFTCPFDEFSFLKGVF